MMTLAVPDSRWGTVALTSAAVAVTAAAQTGQIRDGAPVSFVAADTAVAIAFILGGIGSWNLAPRRSLGTASMVGAIAWQIGTLAIVTLENPITFGLFAMSGYHDAVIAFLLMAYARGRVTGTAARVSLALIIAGFVAGGFTRLLLFQPAAWGCETCATNPLAVSDDEMLFISIQDWIGRWLGVAVGAVAIVTVARWVRRSVPARRAAGVLPFAGVIWALLFFQDVWLRPIDALVVEDPAAFYVLASARAAVPLGVLSGLVWIRLRQSQLAGLFTSVRDAPRRDEVETVLRTILGQPELELWWRLERTDTFARACAPGESQRTITPRRHEVVTELHGADNRILGLLRHDATLLDDDRFGDAVTSAVRLIGEHDRLAGQVRDQLSEVRESRARILTAAAEERTRLERDLHDGSQQRLVGLALQLRMARGIIDEDASPSLAEALDLASKELAEAIADLRELARGIHPAALTDGGLRNALPLLADRTPIPVAIDIQIADRLNPTVETTLYFVASEALANIAKHSGASQCTIVLQPDGESITMAITDNGSGGARETPHGGLRGLRDRVEALGGSLEISSATGHGTTLTATIPLDETTIHHE